MDIIKEKVINFVKTYISFIASILICLVYIAIDLIVFNVNNDPKIVIPKAIIYLAISTTINALLRRQGIIWGNMEKDFILTKQQYNEVVDVLDTSKLDEFCEFKNDQRKVQLLKKKLRWAKLSYEKYENGEYELISKEDSVKYSKRQLKAIKYCNKLEVEMYDSDYLTKDIESERNYKSKNVSQTKYMSNKNAQSLIIGVVTSLAFAYLTASLAQDISWANVFYSTIKVVTWLVSGVLSLVSAYVFVTITYKEVLKDKTVKLKEYTNWLKFEQSNKINN